MPNSRINKETIKRALIIKLRHHGDVLLSTPVVNALHDQLPNIKIDILIYNETRDMIQYHPRIEDVHCVNREWKKKGTWHLLKKEITLYRQLKNKRYDLILNLSDNWRGAFLSRLLKPQLSSAECYTQRPQFFWRNSYTHPSARVDFNSLHTIDRNLKSVAAVGLDYPSPPVYDMGLSPDVLAKISSLFIEKGLMNKFRVHIHPGARWGFKCWDNNKWIEVIRYLQKHDVAIIMSAAPTASELRDVDTILEQTSLKNITNLSGQLSLQELGAAISLSNLFLGVDSAPMHMAAAFQLPCLAIFGPSFINEWRPWGENSMILNDDNNIAPLSVDTSSQLRLTENISVKMLIDSIDALIP